MLAISELILGFTNILPQGLIFGFIDNSILLLGAYTGVSIEKYLNKKASGVLGGVLGATMGNSISDAVGAILDPSMRGMLFGIVIGTIIPIFFIPLIEIIRNK